MSHDPVLVQDRLRGQMGGGGVCNRRPTGYFRQSIWTVSRLLWSDNARRLTMWIDSVCVSSDAVSLLEAPILC
jgi:hypothetical protein